MQKKNNQTYKGNDKDSGKMRLNDYLIFEDEDIMFFRNVGKK